MIETFERCGALVDIGVNDIDLPFSYFAHSEEEADAFFAEAAAALKETGWIRA